MNIIYKFFKSLFLFIMSILKTLSSNYVPLLVVCIAIFVILTILSKRIITLPCSDCSNGSWWYKCTKKTGYGTKTCKRYTFITDTLEDFLDLLKNGTDKYLMALLMVIRHTTNILKKTVQFVDETTRALIFLRPDWLLFKYLIGPITKEIRKAFKSIKDLVKNFSCSFTIPVINEEINICSTIKKGLKELIKIFKSIMKLIMDVISSIATEIWNFIKNSIVTPLLNLIKSTINLITSNILGVFIQATKLLSEIKKPFEIIFNLPLSSYFILLVDYVIELILTYIPGASFLRYVPSLIIFIALLPIILVIIVPIIGSFIALFALIKSLVFAILGCDDNNDLIYLFKTLIMYFVNKIMSLF